MTEDKVALTEYRPHTALDISGYGLLLYKYLKERERTSKQNGRNMEHENEILSRKC